MANILKKIEDYLAKPVYTFTVKKWQIYSALATLLLGTGALCFQERILDDQSIKNRGEYNRKIKTINEALEDILYDMEKKLRDLEQEESILGEYLNNLKQNKMKNDTNISAN